MTRIRAIALALVWLAAAPAARAQESPSAGRPALISADEVSYDEDLGIVVASGNVEVSQGERVLLADSVTYNQRTRVVSASGNVSLLEPDGKVLFADYFKITDDLKNGIARRLSMLMEGDARFAAAGGSIRDGIETRLNKVVYSPCRPCSKDPTGPLLWQIKAARVTHNTETRDVVYHDAWLEMWGVPVLYTPYFSHPDPTVERRSGFLAPEVGNDSQLGLVARTPYFFVIDDSRDFTLEPIVTSKERGVLAGQYRQRLATGELQANGSITRVVRRGPDGEALNEDTTRGHLFSFGRFDLDRTWRWGYDLQYATDDTYLRRYDFDSTDRLTTSPFIEGFRGRNYTSARAFYFRGLRKDDNPGQTPLVLPFLEYNHIGQPDSIGARWAIDANALATTRSDGADSRRLSLKLGWAVPYTSPWGDVWTLSASLQNDAYSVNGVPRRDRPGTQSGVTGRVFPQAMLRWQYPFLRQSGATRQVVEPVAALVLAPNGGNPSKISNEDSTDFEFDDTNLFSANRFPGFDRVNVAQRIVYGLKGAVYGNTRGSSEFFLGQSYRLRPDDTFEEGSGLRDQVSDIVGRVRISPTEYFDLLYRFRLARNDLGPVRNEVKTGIGPPAFRIGANYLFFNQTRQVSEFPEREEITLNVSSQVTRKWSVRAGHRRDLTTDGGALSTSIGLTYECECFIFTADFTRSITRDRDFERSDTIFFRFIFKTLGQFKTGS